METVTTHLSGEMRLIQIMQVLSQLQQQNSTINAAWHQVST